MNNVIPFDRFDRRATHRIFSEPVALDLINDVTAEGEDAVMACRNARFATNEVIDLSMRAHLLALGTGDEELVRLIGRIHDGSLTQARTLGLIGGKVTHVLSLARQAAALAQDSEAVDPYLALGISGPEGAA